MRKMIMAGIAVLPMLLTCSQAAQTWTFDQNSGSPWIFGSEDSEKSSYLGVDIADVTSERLGILKLKEEKGVEVTMVDQDAPAGKAGIKEHDVILSMNGTPVESGAQLRRMIHETPAGRLVTLGISRDGQPITVKLQLADKHKAFPDLPHPDINVHVPEIHIPDIDIPAMTTVVVTSSARSGLMVENITPQLGDFFGVKNGNGVLIRSVEKGSRAEKAGFRAGDIIVKINDQAVHDISDFSHAVKSRSGNSVNVGVVRDKKEQTLSLTLPERKQQSDMFEEDSFDGEPLFNADSFDWTQAKNEWAHLQPLMELAFQDSRDSMEKAGKELCKQQKDVQKEFQKQKVEFQKNMERWRVQIKKMQEDWL
jgi:membrane-associated protease RseP (regulator of RpoE activity)